MATLFPCKCITKMKKIFCILVSLQALFQVAFAQVDRSAAPQPGPAPQVNIGTPASFTLPNGIRVFVVENHKVPKVTVSLVLKKDPILEKDKAGYVSMAGEMMRRGTVSRTKAQLDEEVDFLGGSLATSSESASASSLTRNFDKLFSIFSDVVLHPAFRDSELAKLKKQTLSDLEAQKDDPASIASNVVSVVNFGKDFPYGEVVTDSSVSRIGVEDLKRYYHTFWKPNISYMAFVGDITAAHARELAEKYLGSWKKGVVPKQKYPVPVRPDSTLITVVDRPSAVQTSIYVTDPVVLKPGDMENFPVKVMNHILGGGSASWLFGDLREKYGFTYGAYSRISNDPLVGSFAASAEVRTSVTDSAIVRFLYELNRIGQHRVDQAVLDSAKNEISGNFALALERPALIAQFALNVARYNMPKDYYKNYLKSIAAVTTEDVARAALRYVTPGKANIVLVGNARGFADSLARFGKVRYVDMYGNPVAAPEIKTVPASLTAGQVIDNYLTAIGGKEKLQGVKDMTIHLAAEMMGHPISVTQQYLIPGYFEMRMKLDEQDMDVMKIRVVGDSVGMESMGQAVPMNDDRRSELLVTAHPFREMTFLDGKHVLKLSGIEPVDGKDAYRVDVTDTRGSITSYYFDTKSGLELRSVSNEKTPQGTVQRSRDMGDYQETGGIKIPHVVKSQNGSQTIRMKVQDVKINTGLTPADFK